MSRYLRGEGVEGRHRLGIAVTTIIGRRVGEPPRSGGRGPLLVVEWLYKMPAALHSDTPSAEVKRCIPLPLMAMTQRRRPSLPLIIHATP